MNTDKVDKVTEEINLIEAEINFGKEGIVDKLRGIAAKDPDFACHLGKRARQVIIPTLVKINNGIEERTKG